MQTIRWTRLLAVGMLAVPMAGRAQTAAPKGPQPKITEIATIPGVDVDEVVRMPNGHVLVYSAWDDRDEGYLAAYDITTKKITPITYGFDVDLAITLQGNRIAYTRLSENGKESNIWTIALDPKSGRPTGPAQRVTNFESDAPSFSPDGKLIAFSRGGTTGRNAGPVAEVLSVIPAAGGPQRIVARYDKVIQNTAWSTDGRWIYVQLAESSGNRDGRIERVPSAGGKSDLLFQDLHQAIGLADGRLAFENWTGATLEAGRIAYADMGGVRGEFTIPPRSYFGTSPGAPQPLLTRSVSSSALHVLDLQNGKVRDLPYKGADAGRLSWSRDQSQLAFGSGDGSSLGITVMGADGSAQRHYPVPGGAAVPFWSPDGKSLVNFASDTGEIQLLNLAAGTTRVLAAAVPGKRFYNIAWRPDGKAFYTLSATTAASQGSRHATDFAVVEVGLDGHQRVVRDLWAEFPSMWQAFLVSTKEVVLEFGDSVSRGPTRILVVPLDGGAARPVLMPALKSGMWRSFVTGFSETRFTMDQVDASNKVAGIEMISLGAEATRVTPVPPNRYTVKFNQILPNGEQILRMGAEATGGYTLYSIATAGGAPRALLHTPLPIVGMSGWGSGLAPDGNRLAYFSKGPSISHVSDVDLSPILNLIKKP